MEVDTMAVMAAWLSKKWEVSNSKVVTLNNFSGSREIEVESKSSETGNQAQDVKGFKNRSMTFDFTLSAVAGFPDVQSEINSWESLVGQKAPFYIKGKKYGADKYLLTKAAHSNVIFANDGTMLQATIAVTFEEYSQTANSTKTSTSAQSNAALQAQTAAKYSTRKTSAVNVGATADDKASMKNTKRKVVVNKFEEALFI